MKNGTGFEAWTNEGMSNNMMSLLMVWLVTSLIVFFKAVLLPLVLSQAAPLAP